MHKTSTDWKKKQAGGRSIYSRRCTPHLTWRSSPWLVTPPPGTIETEAEWTDVSVKTVPRVTCLSSDQVHGLVQMESVCRSSGAMSHLFMSLGTFERHHDLTPSKHLVPTFQYISVVDVYWPLPPSQQWVSSVSLISGWGRRLFDTNVWHISCCFRQTTIHVHAYEQFWVTS